MHRWQRALAATAAGPVLLLAGATPAQAAPQTTVTTFDAGITCVGTTTGGERAFVTFGTSAECGDSVFASVGAEDDPRLVAFSAGGGWNGGAPAYALDVYDAEFERVGEGSVSATTSVRNETETTSRGGSRNQQVRAHVVAATLDVVAILELPGVRIAALDCSGSQTTTTFEANAPASTVRSQRNLYDTNRCDGNAVVAVFGPAEGEYFLSVDVERDGQQFHLFGPIDEPRGTFTVDLPLRNSDTGDTMGRYPVTVQMTESGPTTRQLLRTAIARVTQAYTWYDVTGSVSLPWGEFQATCEVLEVQTREIIRASQGPKPGGTPPANDVATAAAPLTVGSTVRTTTRAASLDAEAEMTCADAPVGRTLWYSFVGTGEPVRIDTAGSSFDTVLSVYRAGGGEYREVACGNDLRDASRTLTSLQGTVELPTRAGVTYHVQVGGIFADYGRLVLSLGG